MNASLRAQQAYAPNLAPTRSMRRVEYDVIARITFRLKKAIEEGTFAELVEAVHENRNLWQVLAIDVADEDNQLPKDLRARLFYLAEFTEAQSSKVIRREDTAIPLLEVNTAILRGLKSTGLAG